MGNACPLLDPERVLRRQFIYHLLQLLASLKQNRIQYATAIQGSSGITSLQSHLTTPSDPKGSSCSKSCLPGSVICRGPSKKAFSVVTLNLWNVTPPRDRTGLNFASFLQGLKSIVWPMGMETGGMVQPGHWLY